jgi:hypothetical protein
VTLTVLAAFVAGSVLALAVESWYADSAPPERTEMVPAASAAAPAPVEVRDRMAEWRDAWSRIEPRLADIGSLSCAELTELRRRLAELDAEQREVHAVSSNVVHAIRRIDDALPTMRLLEAARTAARVPGREAIAAHPVAEDALRKVLEGLMRGPHDTETQRLFEGLCRQCIAESDALCERVFTPDFINEIPWMDLLAAEQAKAWRTVGDIAGFTLHVADGTLVASMEAGTREKGLFLVGDREQWRHFVLEVDFAVDHGAATMWLRLRIADTRQSEAYELSAKDQGALTPGKSYSMLARFIGSHLMVDFPASPGVAGAPARHDTDAQWYKRRRGAIGFTVPAGTRLTITRMRIRVLP